MESFALPEIPATEPAFALLSIDDATITIGLDRGHR